jgi:hypothetical protein
MSLGSIAHAAGPRKRTAVAIVDGAVRGRRRQWLTVQ